MTNSTPRSRGHFPRRARAAASGRRLGDAEAAQVKGMILRGDRQHDIAAWFGVNPGRIAEISTGKRFAEIVAAEPHELPPAGPYRLN